GLSSPPRKEVVRKSVGAPQICRFRRSRESGNPGISVACPWAPAFAGATIGGSYRFDYSLEKRGSRACLWLEQARYSCGLAAPWIPAFEAVRKSCGRTIRRPRESGDPGASD